MADKIASHAGITVNETQYAARNPDLAKNGWKEGSFAHYLKYGFKEGRDPTPRDGPNGTDLITESDKKSQSNAEAVNRHPGYKGMILDDYNGKGSIKASDLREDFKTPK